MQLPYIDVRKAAGYSRERTGVEAGTTSSTVRLFELAGPDAVRDTAKRGRLVALYDRLRAQAAPSPAPSAALPHPNKTRSAWLTVKSATPNDTGPDQL